MKDAKCGDCGGENGHHLMHCPRLKVQGGGWHREIVVEDVARTAHEVNRTFCIALGDHSHARWEQSPGWQRRSAIMGVLSYIDNPRLTPAESHANWMAEKAMDGWTFGPEKDERKKTHPCMVPYDELPPEQQTKDHLFRATVLSLLGYVVR